MMKFWHSENLAYIVQAAEQSVSIDMLSTCSRPFVTDSSIKAMLNTLAVFDDNGTSGACTVIASGDQLERKIPPPRYNAREQMITFLTCINSLMRSLARCGAI